LWLPAVAEHTPAIGILAALQAVDFAPGEIDIRPDLPVFRRVIPAKARISDV
jgi:hypothetical protein